MYFITYALPMTVMCVLKNNVNFWCIMVNVMFTWQDIFLMSSSFSCSLSTDCALELRSAIATFDPDAITRATLSVRESKVRIILI